MIITPSTLRISLKFDFVRWKDLKTRRRDDHRVQYSFADAEEWSKHGELVDGRLEQTLCQKLTDFLLDDDENAVSVWGDQHKRLVSKIIE